MECLMSFRVTSVDRCYLVKSAAERLRPEYKDLSQSIGALASKLRARNNNRASKTGGSV